MSIPGLVIEGDNDTNTVTVLYKDNQIGYGGFRCIELYVTDEDLENGEFTQSEITDLRKTLPAIERELQKVFPNAIIRKG